jgi:bifunctional hydroxylase/dehydrase
VDVRYDRPGRENALAGQFVPDLALRLDNGEIARARDLFAAGRAVLLDLADDPAVRKVACGWTDRVDIITASPVGPRDHAPTGPLLTRPDGYVAWAGAEGLEGALETWFGQPRS